MSLFTLSKGHAAHKDEALNTCGGVIEGGRSQAVRQSKRQKQGTAAEPRTLMPSTRLAGTQ